MSAHFKYLVFAFLTLSSPAFALDSVNVMADNSLNIAIAEIARSYSRDKDIIVNTSYISPAAQQSQITEGGAADILITPQASLVDTLKGQGLVDVYSQTLLAKDHLVLVGPADSTLVMNLSRGFSVAPLIWQMGGEPGFVVANPQTLPEGSYSKDALRNMNVADDLEPYTLYVKRRDQMLEMVASKDYGVFFNSVVVGRPGIRVLDFFPDNSYPAIQYYAVVIAGENMSQARKFLDYLKSDPAKRILRDNGFSVD